MTFLLVAAGGAAGSLARWGLGGWIQGTTGAAFPWGTLVVNVIGCAAIGALAAFAPRWGLPEPWRIGLQVGVLGGFTTFSSYAVEAQQLVDGAHLAVAALYLALTVVAALVAVVLGLTATRRAVGLVGRA